LNESFGVKTYLAIIDFINNKPVIILSNLDESLVADSLMHHGAYVFVSKNELDISNFEQIIKNALARYGKVVQKNTPFVQAPIQMLKNEVATNFSNSDLEESLSRNINVYRQTMAKFHDMPLNILDPEVFRDFVQLYSKAFDQLMSLTAIDVNKIKHVLSVNFDAQIDAILMLKLSPNDFYLIHQDCIRTKILKEEDELKAKTILFYFLNYLFNAYQMA